MSDSEDGATETIPAMLKYRAGEEGDRQMFRFYDRHGSVSNLTFTGVYRLAGKFAHLLRSWGFQKGEVIANGLPNSPERVISDFGVIMSGCILANCQVIEKDGKDFWYTARTSRCKGVILSARLDNTVYQIFSKNLQEDASGPSSLKADSFHDSRFDSIVQDVSIPQAPTIRKIIVCDRLVFKTPRDDEAAIKVGTEEHLGEQLVPPQEKQMKPHGQVITEQREKQGQETGKIVHKTLQQNQQSSHSLIQNRSSFLEELKTLDDVTEFYHADCHPSDLALLLSTSGTTGFNKLVPATHDYILGTGKSLGKQSRDMLNWNDRPLGWMGGYPLDVLTSGTCRVLQDFFNDQGVTNSRELWGLISETKCHGLALMPYDVMRLVDEFERDPPDYKALYISTGSQAIRKELSKAVGLLCQALIVSYGCSEGGAFSLGIIAEHPEQLEDFYCGKVLKDSVQVKILDEEEKELSAGVVGEISVKSDRIIKAYYNAEAASTTTSKNQPMLYTQDGWYKTGDRGKLLDDGSLYCYGRQGDVISINGVIIYLSWLESILNKCPGVGNSSVIGLGDDVIDRKKHRESGKDGDDGRGRTGSGGSGNGGVIFCGFVEAKPSAAAYLTEEELKDFFVESLVDTNYKDKLKLSHVFIMDMLPLIPTRKVNKRALVEMVVGRIGNL